MMLSLSDAIPKAEALLRRAKRPDSVKPTPDALAKMQGLLADYGYNQEPNHEVYTAICSYGALMLDKTNHRGLLLKGECGIGKSFGVECLAAIFRMPVYTPDNFAAAYKELDGNKEKLGNAVTSGGDFFGEPHDIVIDELGTLDSVRNWGEAADIMCDVLDMRYRAMLRYGVKTIITTNLSDKGMLERYGRRIEDRLREMCYIKRVTGVSLR